MYLAARQPIFDRKQNVFAYQLLLSLSFDEAAASETGTVKLLDEIAENMLGGKADRTSDRKIFINVNTAFINRSQAVAFPKDKTVLFLSEPGGTLDEAQQACDLIKGSGLDLALGDFASQDKYRALAEKADYLVVDFQSMPESDLRLVPMWSQAYGVKTLGLNLNTRAAFDRAKEFGYDYFQGAFFIDPVIVPKEKVPGFKLNYLRLLREINHPDIDFHSLEDIIKQDVSLTYKLLKYINSAAFGLVNNIESIGHALTLLGALEIKKWATLVAMTSMGEDLPEEAMVTCVIRGKFLEELGRHTGLSSKGDDLFFMGIFSMIDVFVGRPKEEVLNGIPIDHAIKQALLGAEGQLKAILDLVLAYEEGDWDPLHDHLEHSGIRADVVPEMYLSALDVSQNIFLN